MKILHWTEIETEWKFKTVVKNTFGKNKNVPVYVSQGTEEPWNVWHGVYKQTKKKTCFIM